MRRDDQFTDVTLQSGDVHIRCHRSVLSAVSDYFKAMFTCGLEETTSATVRLTIEPDLLTYIVGHIYTGEIELSVDNVETFVKAGDLLYSWAPSRRFVGTFYRGRSCRICLSDLANSQRHIDSTSCSSVPPK